MKHNRRYMHPVSVGTSPETYAPAMFNSSGLLEGELRNRGLDITFGQALKGGVVSQVYEAVLEGEPVVVKHTEHLVPFDPTEFFIDKAGHNIDTHVLQLLAETDIKVPGLIHHFPEITTTVMEDVRKKDFRLLHEMILDHDLDAKSAISIGASLARLAQLARTWEAFATNEVAEQSIYERGLELRLAYPTTQTPYLALEKEFVGMNEFWVWPDGHPKNMFVNDQGAVIFIDFGRSHWGDQRYMLPNFLAHIVLYTLAGYISPDLSHNYIQDAVKGYKQHDEIDESLFCRYLAMEVLHRANGKWIQGIEGYEQKLACWQFGLRVFDEKVDTIDSLLRLL